MLWSLQILMNQSSKIVMHVSIGNSSMSTSRRACKQSNAPPSPPQLTFPHSMPQISSEYTSASHPGSHGLALKSTLFPCSIWTKFNEVMTNHVEAAFHNRALAPTPTLRLPHPLTGVPVDYAYDFSTAPMTQVASRDRNEHES
jgi:hypothetical protein